MLKSNFTDQWRIGFIMKKFLSNSFDLMKMLKLELAGVSCLVFASSLAGLGRPVHYHALGGVN